MDYLNLTDADIGSMSDAELDAAIAASGRSADASPSPAPAPAGGLSDDDIRNMSDEELDAAIAGTGAQSAAPAPAKPLEPTEPAVRLRPSTNEEANMRARRGNDSADSVAMAAIKGGLEGAWKGGARALKAAAEPFVGLASGAVRLAGTVQRAVTGNDSLHRTADAMDAAYANWGADALDLGYEDALTKAGNAGEKIAGIAGTLGSMAVGGGAGRALGALGGAGKVGKVTSAIGNNVLPALFANDAATRTYDVAKQNGLSDGEALGLAATSGAISAIGFKLFENKSLNKMLGIPNKVSESILPAFLRATEKDVAPKTFSELVGAVRKASLREIVAERARGALKAGGIMGMQNFLSSIPNQIAEGQEVDFARALAEGAEGVKEGALMEGLTGGAAALLTTRKYVGDQLRNVIKTKEGRKYLMAQNLGNVSDVYDRVMNREEVTPEMLDGAGLPPDMTADELNALALDLNNDIYRENPVTRYYRDPDQPTRVGEAEIAADQAYRKTMKTIADESERERNPDVEDPGTDRGGLDPVEEQFRVASDAVEGNRAEYDRWLADAGREDSPQARVDWFVRARTDVAAAETQMRLQAAEQGGEDEFPEPTPPSEPAPAATATGTGADAPVGAPKTDGVKMPADEKKPAEAAPRASGEALAATTAETARPIDTNAETSYTKPAERTTENGQPEQQTRPADAGNGGTAAGVTPEDEFSRLLGGSRQMAEEERRAFADGSKALDESDLGSPVGGRSENRKGRVVDVLRARIASGNGGAGLDSVTEAKIPFSDRHGEETFRIGQTDAATFHDVFEYVRSHLKNGELVDLHDVKDYENADCYLSEDGLSGFAVTPDGNLISVFSLRRGSLGAMKDAIIAAGANHLDAFASKNQNLRVIYEKTLGFKPVSDMDFNPAYDQSGIGAKHGNPDVTFMALPKKGQEFARKRFGKDDYDAAVAHLNAEIAKPPRLIRPDAGANAEGNGRTSYDADKQKRYEEWLFDKAIDDAIEAKLPADSEVAPRSDTPENRAEFEREIAREESGRKSTDETLARQRKILEKRGEDKAFVDWLERHGIVVVSKQGKGGKNQSYALDKERADYARDSFMNGRQGPQGTADVAQTQNETKKNTLRTASGMSPKVFREYKEWLEIEGSENEGGEIEPLQDTPENRKRFLAEREERAAAMTLDVGKLRKEGAQTVVSPEEAQALPQTVDEIVDVAAKVFGVTPEFDKSQPGNAEYRNEIKQTIESLTPEKRLQYAKLLKAQAEEGGYSKQTAAAERRIGWEEANGLLLGRTKKAPASGGIAAEIAAEAERKSTGEERLVEAEARKAEAEAAKAEAEAGSVASDVAKPVASGNRPRIAPEPVKNDALAAFMPESVRGKATFREERVTGESAVFIDGKNTGVFVGRDGKFFLPGKSGRFDSFDQAQAFLSREATSFKTGQRVSFKADDGTVVSGQAIVRPDGSLAIRTKQKDPRNPFANVVKDVEVPKDKMSSVAKIGVRESRVEASETVPETWDAKVKADVQKAAERVKGWLKGVKVRFADGPSEGGAESRDLRSEDGTVVGSYDRATNEVTLYPGATVGTVAHEIGWHATYKFAEDEAKAGRTQLKQTLDGYIDNAPKVIKDAVRAAYGDLPEDAMRDEIGAHVFEQKHGAELEKALRTMEGRAWYNRVWDAIKRVAGKMLKAFGVDVNRVDLARLERMKPEDGMAWLAKQFAEGKTLGTVDATESGTVEGGTDGGAIRYSRRPLPPGSSPMDEKRGKGSKLREWGQDSDIEVRNVQDDIGGVQDKVDANGHTALDSQDVYAAKMRANGYVERGIRDVQQRRDNLSKVLADNDITPEAFDKFLTAMHAEERNRTTSARDGRAYDPTSKFGSSMSEVDARAYLASPEVASKRAAFDAAGKIVWDMNKADLKRRLDSGRISQDQYDLLTNQWQHYVPLRTDAENGSLNAFNMSTAGFRANEFAMAKGRESEAASPTAFSFLQAQQGVNGSERNVVNTTLANLVRHAEDSGKPIGEIVEGEMQPRGTGWTFQFADGERVVADGASKLAANHDNIVLFKEDGVLKAIRIQPGEEGRGVDFAKAVTGENVGKWGKGLQWIPRMTRFMSEMLTQYSLTFSVRNVLADHLESQQAFVGRYGLRDGLALAMDAIKAEFRENGNLRAYFRDGTLNGRVKEFVEGGGLIKGGVAAMGFAGEQNEIRDTYAKYVRKAKGFAGMTNAERAKTLWDGAFDLIKNANEILENSTRFGIFSALRDKGVSTPEAVKFAREATVDFNRKGTAMPWFNGLYMFANAAMQGTARAGRAFVDDWKGDIPSSGLGSKRRHGELTATLIALGVAKAVLDHFVGDDDDREKAGGRNARNLTEYDKKHLLGVPVGGGNQVVLLRTRGTYAAIPYIAQTLANVALGETDWEDAAKNIATEVGSQAVDIAGGNGLGSKSEALQTLMPSVGDPFVQWATGTDYKGEDRVKRTFDRNQPASHNGRDSTSAAFKAAAKSINFITGGNENRKGFLDWAPEDIQLAWDTVFGGVGRDVSNLAEGAENAYRRFVKGEKPERGPSAYPFLKDIVREYPENTQRFYDAFGKYEADKAEFRKTTDIKRRAELKREHPYLSQGKGRIDNLKDRIDDLRHLEKNEVKNGNKWVARKHPISDERRNAFRARRLRLQASVLKILGE